MPDRAAVTGGSFYLGGVDFFIAVNDWRFSHHCDAQKSRFLLEPQLCE
jgi:hypothetical protein